MKQQAVSIFVSLVLFFLLLSVYTKLAGPIPFTVNSINTTKTDSFSVTGEGKSTVKPDIAVVNAGISATGPTVKQVQDQINGVINKVSEVVKNQGVDSKDIQTSNYNIHPTYDYTGGSQKITGYQADTNLVIKIKSLDKANSVIDAATSNGANQIGGITFDVADKTKAEDEARQQAVAEAKKKAEEAAKIAGFSLGKIINYSENFGNNPQPIPLMGGAQKAQGAPTQIEPGSNEIQVTVTLSYEVR